MGIIFWFIMGVILLCKKSKLVLKYFEKWEVDFWFMGWLMKLKYGLLYVYCWLCNWDFRVDNGGFNDVMKYFNMGMYKNNSKV